MNTNTDEITIWAVGSNAPGYLPEDPENISRTLSWDWACELLKEILDREADRIAETLSDEPEYVDQALEDNEGELALAHLAAARRDDPHQPFSTYVDGRVFWIIKTTPQDDAERKRALVALDLDWDLSDVTDEDVED